MPFLNLLVSSCCLFLLLFSTHLFFAKKGNQLLNILLSVIFFARFGQILNAFLITSYHTNVLAIPHQLFTPFYYAAPACFYLYIYNFLHHKNQLNKLEWLHFIPAVLAIIHVIPWPFTPSLNWEVISTQLAENGYFSLTTNTGLFPPYFQNILRPVLISTYLCLSWVAIIRFKPNEKTAQEGEKNWIIFFLKISTFFQILGLLRVILQGFHIPFSSSLFMIINCLFLLAIVLYALHKPYIFYGYLLVAVDWSKKSDIQKEEKILHLKNSKPGIFGTKIISISKPIKKVNLNSEQLENYTTLMKDLMHTEKLYVHQDFQIIDLAARLNIPIHHCSYILNNEIGKNFRDWINGYRVRYFLDQYASKKDKITIEAMASESGFKSLATFYNAFKKETGLMPTAYLDNEYKRSISI